MNNQNEKLYEKLKNLRSFNDESLVLGIPSKLFGGCLIMSLAVMALFSKFFGFLLIIALLVPLYIVHKDDPQAAQLYLSEFSAPDLYTFDVEESNPIVIIDDYGDSINYENRDIESHLTPKILSTT
mgnify:CR=1 FL=1